MYYDECRVQGYDVAFQIIYYYLFIAIFCNPMVAKWYYIDVFVISDDIINESLKTYGVLALVNIIDYLNVCYVILNYIIWWW